MCHHAQLLYAGFGDLAQDLMSTWPALYPLSYLPSLRSTSASARRVCSGHHAPPGPLQYRPQCLKRQPISLMDIFGNKNICTYLFVCVFMYTYACHSLCGEVGGGQLIGGGPLPPCQAWWQMPLFAESFCQLSSYFLQNFFSVGSS